MAAASNYVYYANGNLASQEFLIEDVIGDPAIYPTRRRWRTSTPPTPYPPRVQRTVTRLWTKIKSGT
jgi:putrescine transport system substrate-binding protein